MRMLYFSEKMNWMEISGKSENKTNLEDGTFSLKSLMASINSI